MTPNFRHWVHRPELKTFAQGEAEDLRTLVFNHFRECNSVVDATRLTDEYFHSLEEFINDNPSGVIPLGRAA